MHAVTSCRGGFANTCDLLAVSRIASVNFHSCFFRPSLDNVDMAIGYVQKMLIVLGKRFEYQFTSKPLSPRVFVLAWVRLDAYIEVSH